MRTISASRNRKRFLRPVFPTIYDLGAIQFPDTLMPDGYFHIFLTDESNLNVSEISIHPLSELIVQYQIQINGTGDINSVKNQCVYPVGKYEYDRYSHCLSNMYEYCNIF